MGYRASNSRDEYDAKVRRQEWLAMPLRDRMYWRAVIAARLLLALAVISVLVAATVRADGMPPFAKTKPATDDRDRKAIINEARAERLRIYGPCPCPFDIAIDNSVCGGRSAYSKSGNLAPICYPTDVTQDMIVAYRQKRRNAP